MILYNVAKHECKENITGSIPDEVPCFSGSESVESKQAHCLPGQCFK